MKKIAVFIIFIICSISFTLPAWSKGGKDGDPPVVKTSGDFNLTKDIYDGDPPAPPK